MSRHFPVVSGGFCVGSVPFWSPKALWRGLGRWVLPAVRVGGRGGRDALEGGEVPPSRAPSLCPATVPLTPSASVNGVCNRQ